MRTWSPSSQAWATSFVADIDQARAALEGDTSFNLIHTSSYLKVDVFPLTSSFNKESVRRSVVVMLQGATIPLRVAAVEDVLLAKLRWYRLGGEVSEVQWRDISALIRLNRERLDASYLSHWASELGVRDLLETYLRSAE